MYPFITLGCHGCTWELLDQGGNATRGGKPHLLGTALGEGGCDGGVVCSEEEGRQLRVQKKVLSGEMSVVMCAMIQ